MVQWSKWWMIGLPTHEHEHELHLVGKSNIEVKINSSVDRLMQRSNPHDIDLQLETKSLNIRSNQPAQEWKQKRQRVWKSTSRLRNPDVNNILFGSASKSSDPYVYQFYVLCFPIFISMLGIPDGTCACLWYAGLDSFQRLCWMINIPTFSRRANGSSCFAMATSPESRYVFSCLGSQEHSWSPGIHWLEGIVDLLFPRMTMMNNLGPLSSSFLSLLGQTSNVAP